MSEQMVEKDYYNALAYVSFADPYRGWSEDAKAKLAIDRGISSIERYVTNGKVFVPALDPKVSRINELRLPVYQRVGYEGQMEFVGFDISETAAEELYQLFGTSPEAADAVLDIVATNFLFGRQVPEILQFLSAELLMKKRALPKRKPVKTELSHRNTLIVLIAKGVESRFGIGAGAQRERFTDGYPPPVRGATIAASVMHALGVTITHRRANKIVQENGDLNKFSDTIPIVHILAAPPSNRLATTMSGPLPASAEKIEKAWEYLTNPI